MQQLLTKPALSNPAVGSWLRDTCCPECGMPRLALLPTVDGDFTAQNCSIVCLGGCQIEFPLDEILRLYPAVLAWLPDGEDPGPAKFGRGPEANVTFGKGYGATGKARSEQFRYAIDRANDWRWDPKRPNGVAERDRLYAMKATVGVFEDKAMKSALEMNSRKIERLERARNTKISEAMVDRISKLVRKGVVNAEARRPTTPRERRLIVEAILRRQGLWPP